MFMYVRNIYVYTFTKTFNWNHTQGSIHTRIPISTIPNEHRHTTLCNKITVTNGDQRVPLSTVTSSFGRLRVMFYHYPEAGSHRGSVTLQLSLSPCQGIAINCLPVVDDITQIDLAIYKATNTGLYSLPRVSIKF